MLKFSTKILVFVSILFTSNQVAAGRVASLYDVEVPVVNESSSVRKQAFDQGLDEVFIRISGDSMVMDKLKRPPSSRYVKQFSYEPMDSPTASDVAKKDGKTRTYRLKIQYNGRLMEKYLLDNGFPVWGEYRSDVVVWLVVRDGRSEYVLKGSDSSLLKTSTAEALARRGIPVSWPVYDKKDKKALNVSDIRGGFKGPVLNASRRYSSGPALTGSMIWNGKRWQGGWNLLLDGENRHWNLENADHKQLINKAIDQAADVLGGFFAVRNAASKQQAVAIQLDIQAVNSIEKYRYVEDYLSGLSAVDKVKPFKVDGQYAVFEVSLRSNEEDFLNLIKREARLIEVKVQPVKTQKIIENKPATAPATAPTTAPATAPANAPASVVTSVEQKDIAIDVVAEATEAEKSRVYLPIKQLPVYYYRLELK